MQTRQLTRPYIDGMSRIVTYHHRPKRAPRKKAAQASLAAPRIVEAKKSGKARVTPEELPDDPEAEARVAAFFKRMMIPPNS
jgi:hypothetical protein